MRRLITLTETEVFTYLNDLGKTGITNMFVAVVYLEEKFQMSKKQARSYLSLWTENYNPDSNYDEIEIEVN